MPEHSPQPPSPKTSKSPKLHRHVPLMTDSHTAIPKEVHKHQEVSKSNQNEQLNFQNPFSIVNRSTLPPIQRIPTPPSKEIHQNKSFYSDQIIASHKFRTNSRNAKRDADMEPSLLWQSNTAQNIPRTHLASSKVPDIVKRSKLAAIGKTTQDLKATDFKPESYKPKVQIQYVVPPGNKPRRIQVERDRREFLVNKASELEEILTQHGVNPIDLLPPNAYNQLYRPQYNQYREDYTHKRYLGLEIFDNTEYDCRTNTEWMSIGNNGPIPAFALLKDSDNENEPIYNWTKVGVVGFEVNNRDQTTWFVQEEDNQGRVKANLNKINSNKLSFPQNDTQHRIKRINLFFRAEDPVIFAKRLKEAIDHRNEVEGLLKKTLYVDCMPTHDIPITFNLEEILNRTGCEKIFLNPDFNQSLEKIKKQVNLVEQKAENNMIFSKIYSQNLDPESKKFITMKSNVGDNLNVGKVNKTNILEEINQAKALGYNFKAQKQRFEFKSLYTRPEPIKAMVEIQALCQEMMTSKGNLFNTSLSKAQRLEEFEQTQNQQQTLIKLFLQDSWIKGVLLVGGNDIRKILYFEHHILLIYTKIFITFYKTNLDSKMEIKASLVFASNFIHSGSFATV